MPAKKKKRSFGKGGKKATINNPDTHHGTYDLPNASVRSYSEKAKPMKFARGNLVDSGEVDDNAPLSRNNPSAFERGLNMDSNIRAITGMAKGGSVESKKMMNMGGMAGYKSGGSCGSSMKKYARGGGIESHGKTKGSMVKMASGGSVSARADGIASKGKTNCKVC
jgi:hypothetical protein